MFAFGRTESVRWDLVAALFMSGVVTSAVGSVFAGVWVAGSEGSTPFTSTVATVIAIALQAFVLRYAVKAMGAGGLSFGGAFLVALVGHMTLALGLFFTSGQSGFAPSLGGMTALLSFVRVFLQYHLLLALIAEETQIEEPHPIVAALVDAEQIGYTDVLSGVRETTGAINYAIAAPTAAGDSVQDELLALAAHERRLRDLGAPARGAEALHAALLEAIHDLRAELVVGQHVRRPELPAADQVLVLARKLAVFAPA